MSEQNRVILTAFMWLFSALALAALFISAAIMGELTAIHAVLAAVILGLAAIASPYIWRMKNEDGTQEKSKRQRVDNLLNDMSDDDLIELKRRLSDVDDRPHTLADTLGDDGELIQRR